MSDLWLTEIIIPKIHADAFMDGFEDFVDSMSCFEDESDDIWKVMLYNQEKPEEAKLKAQVEALAVMCGIETPEFTTSILEQTDWVAKSQEDFKPVATNKFFIHPSWKRDEKPSDLESIEIDPQQAFGTGGHETTKGCVLAIEKLSNEHKFANILDMGCGSGILAIAAAKLQNGAFIMAADNDDKCIEISKKNFTINNISNENKIILSDGYNSEPVKNKAPYDLIIANILAAPLIELAPDAETNLAKGGLLILAGLLKTQAAGVIKAHEKTGLKLIEQNDYNDWSVLLLEK